MTEPLVSIIIPVYNRADLIGETLNSIGQQTYENWECILVDDGSTDDYMLGYIEGDSYSDNFGISITIDNFEGLSSEDKFMHSLEYVGNKTKEEQILSVEWSDDEGETWLSGSIDLSNRFQINRLGKFVRRKFRVGYHGDQQLRIEGLDVTYTQGGS